MQALGPLARSSHGSIGVLRACCMNGRQIRVVLCGAPRVEVLGPGPDHSLDAKTAALLAVLALDGPCPRPHAAQCLWPERSRSQSLANLRKLLSRLRARHGHGLIVDNGVLALGDDVTHDLDALELRTRDGFASEAGELLAGVRADCAEFAAWLDNLRERWRATRLRILGETITEHERAGRLAAAIDVARAVAAGDLLGEHAHRRLMRLHYLRGDSAAALAVFERLRARLMAELGTPPADETVALAMQIQGTAGPSIPNPSPGPLPVVLLRPPKLVGRDGLWDELQRCWRERLPVILLGEPGMGKTRLIEELRTVDANALVTGGRAGDSDVPYAFLARLLREGVQRFCRPESDETAREFARWLPELGHAPACPLEPARLRLALDDVLTQWQRAGMSGVVVDDLHFADAASVSALPVLEARDRRSPAVAWVLGARTHALPAMLTAVLEDGREAIRAVRLTPLNSHDIGCLFATLSLATDHRDAWVDALQRHTGGNPLFVLETLRTLLAGNPRALDVAPAGLPLSQKVGELVVARLRVLSPTALGVLQVAAIAGQDFSVEMASAVLETTPLGIASGWRELESAQVLDASGVGHDVLVDVATQQIPLPIRAGLHRQVAAWLEAHDAGSPARIAAHWEGCDAPTRAAQQWCQAARDAVRLSQHAEAARLFERAVAGCEQAGAGNLAFDMLHEAFVPTLMAAGSGAGEALVARLERDVLTDDQQLRALMVRSQLEVFAGRAGGCVEAAGAARALAARLHRPGELYDASIAYAQGLALLGRSGEALETLDGVHAPGITDLTQRRQYDYYSARGFVLNALQRRREAIEALERALTLARAMGDRSEQVTILTNLAVQYGYQGVAERAAELTETARRIHKQLGTADGVPAVNDFNLAGHWFSLGRYGDALQLLTDVVERFRATDGHIWLSVAESTLATLWLRLGQPGRARQTLSPLPTGLPLFVQAGRVLVEHRISAAMGNGDAAALRDIAARIGDDDSSALVGIRTQLQLARIEPPRDGLQRCRRAGTRAEDFDYRPGVALARVVEAECLMREQRASEASAAARIALRMLAAVRHHEFDPADCSLVGARCLRASGDDSGATALLRAAGGQLQHAAEHDVPHRYRRSFLQCNRTHVDLLSLAGQLRQ